MLVNCPKCGFQQPIDKYCAQCGVDMETFKPAAPPLIQRIFGNTIVQLSLLVVVAGGLGTFLYRNGPSNAETAKTNTASRVQINSNASSSAPAAASFEGQMAPVPADTEAQSTEAAPQDIATARTDGAVIPASTVEALAATPTEKRSLAGVSGPSLIVTYAEVPRSSYQALVDATHSTPNGAYQTFTGYSAGILPGLRDLLNAGTFKMTVLHKETRSVASAKTLQWFYGLKDPRTAADIGFTTFVVLADSDPNDNNLRGSMDVQRGWREPAGPSFEYQRRNFPAEFEITTRTGFFMSGVMPPQANIPNVDELTSIDVFKILRSVPFQRGESEFVIFVEFARDSN